MIKIIIAVLMVLISFPCAADAGVDISDKKEIAKILKSIPFTDKKMDYKNLAERLPFLGLEVSFINCGKFDKYEIELSKGDLKANDVQCYFMTNEPNAALTQVCPVSSLFYFIKRGKKWLPQDKTANFLMNGFGFCVAP